MDEEVVLSEEAGKEQPMPLLVSAFGHKQVHVVPFVTELARLGSQTATKLAILLVEMRRGTLRCHSQGDEGGSHSLLGGAPALGAGVLKDFPLLGGEYWHRFVSSSDDDGLAVGNVSEEPFSQVAQVGVDLGLGA
jgi:hypothetical protein